MFAEKQRAGILNSIRSSRPAGPRALAMQKGQDLSRVPCIAIDERSCGNSRVGYAISPRPSLYALQAILLTPFYQITSYDRAHHNPQDFHLLLHFPHIHSSFLRHEHQIN